MKIDNDKMLAEIDLNETAAYIVQDGEITKLAQREYGRDEIVWKNYKVLDVVRSQRYRIKGGDVL